MSVWGSGVVTGGKILEEVDTSRGKKERGTRYQRHENMSVADQSDEGVRR